MNGTIRKRYNKKKRWDTVAAEYAVEQRIVKVWLLWYTERTY